MWYRNVGHVNPFARLPERRVGDEDLTRLRLVGEARREVHRLAEHGVVQSIGGAHVAGHGYAAPDPDSDA